jgi:uroporphyrinogen decarboxylase
MISRERIRQLLTFREPDRIGVMDQYWIDTVARWRSEGLPDDVEPADYFGFDLEFIYLDASLRLPERLLEDTAEYTIREDKHGFTAKVWKKKSGALGYLDHKIKTREDWQSYRHRLEVDFGTGCRISTDSYFDPFTAYPSWPEMVERFGRLRDGGRFVLLAVYGPLEATWRKHGFEATLTDMKLDPTFMIDMFTTHTDLVLGTAQKALDRGITFDGIFMVEDLAYRSGTFFSPGTYQEALFPSHRHIGDFCDAHGLSLFMHTDGDIRAIIPLLIPAGVKVLQPLEAKAALDVRELKQTYGHDLTFMGNIDAAKMAGSKEVIEEEVRSKVLAAKKGGGYIYHSDHSVPSNVSLDNYYYVMSLVRQYGAY